MSAIPNYYLLTFIYVFFGNGVVPKYLDCVRIAYAMPLFRIERAKQSRADKCASAKPLA